MREWHAVFGNGFTVSVGTNMQFQGGRLTVFPNAPNGMPYGGGFGIETNNFNTGYPVFANYQNGFVSTQAVNYETNLQHTVIGAETNARNEYFGKKTIETVWNSIIDIKNTLFGGPKDNFGGYNSYGLYKNIINGVYQSTSTIGGYIEYQTSLGNVPKTKLSKSFIRTGSLIDKVNNYYNVYNLCKNPSVKNAFTFGIEYIGSKSFPLSWCFMWCFDIAPKLAPEIDYEGIRNGGW